MLKKSKLFFIIVLFFILITPTVFAEDVTTVTPLQDSSVPTTDSKKDDRDNDLLVSLNENYSITENLNGNAFVSATDLTILPDKNNNGLPLIISGNLFAFSTNTTIQSNIVYSDSKDKVGNYMIEKINSIVRIQGNVYAVATDNFTLDSGCVIDGDLYVTATNVTINEQATIKGNLFVFGNSSLNMHGNVDGSVYAIANKYTMNFTGHISKDLSLTVTESANISGKIDRDTKVKSEEGKVITTSDFITGRDLFVETNNFEFAGEVQGDTKISSEALSFNNTKTCLIRGNLDYATKSELTIPDGVVLGETTTSKYTNKTSISYILLQKLVSYVSFLLYVFIVALILKHIAPNFVEKLSNITFNNVMIGLGIGFALLFVIIPVFILLILTNFTIALGIILLLSVLFLSAIAIPLFVLAVANAWHSEKIKLYLRMFIVSTVLFLISLIPTLGVSVMFLIILISIGKILVTLFYKKA